MLHCARGRNGLMPRMVDRGGYQLNTLATTTASAPVTSQKANVEAPSMPAMKATAIKNSQNGTAFEFMRAV